MTDSYSLVPQETNVGPPAGASSCGRTHADQPTDVTFRHSGWQPNRAKIRAALVASGVGAGRLDAWDGCGRDAWVLRSPDPPETFKIVSAKCKDRFCVPCSADRSGKLARRLRERIADMLCSFLTLTLADNDQDLSGLLDKLIGCFRRLRASRLWKENVAGGVSFIELKWNKDLKRWHPHIHCIMDADYIRQDALSDLWLSITKTSFVIDIRRATDTEEAVRYICKYGAKPLHDAFVADPDRLLEAIKSLKGRHLCSVFGEWRSWRLFDDDEHEQWDRVDSLRNLIRRERRGDPEATRIMEALRCLKHRTKPTDQLTRAPPAPSDFTPECPRIPSAFASYADRGWESTRMIASKVLASVPSVEPIATKPALTLWLCSPDGTGMEWSSKPTAFCG